MSVLFWDRQNQPIHDTIDWARKFEDEEYRVIAVDTDGPGEPMVSTIWQGLDLAHNLHVDDDTAMIFETAYLDYNGHVQDRWITHSEEDALEMHRMICVELLERDPRPEDGHVQRIIDAGKAQRGRG